MGYNPSKPTKSGSYQNLTVYLSNPTVDLSASIVNELGTQYNSLMSQVITQWQIDFATWAGAEASSRVIYSGNPPAYVPSVPPTFYDTIAMQAAAISLSSTANIISSTITNNQALLSNAIANPTTFASNAANSASLYSLRTQAYAPHSPPTYTGGTMTAPGHVFDYTQTVQAAITNFQESLQLTKTESGMITLLKKLFSNTKYTLGEQALDDLLIQVSATSAETLSTLTVFVSNLQNAYASQQAILNGAIAAQIAAYTAEAVATNNIVQTTLNNKITSAQAVLTSAATSFQTLRNSVFAGIVAAANATPVAIPQASGNNSPIPGYWDNGVFTNAKGITKVSRSGYVADAIDFRVNTLNSPFPVSFGVPVAASAGSFFTQPNPTVAVSNIATSADTELFHALATLSGNSAVATFANVGTTLTTVDYTFDASGFQTAEMNAYFASAAYFQVSNIGNGVFITNPDYKTHTEVSYSVSPTYANVAAEIASGLALPVISSGQADYIIIENIPTRLAVYNLPTSVSSSGYGH